MFFRRRRSIRRTRSGLGCLLLIVVIMLGLFLFLRAARAQAQGGAYDAVNAVAARMYCPECENVPLDKCFTEVCTQWKREIAEQLSAGRTSDQIVDDFVARFGDQVVGVPQDATLRAITLASPWILAAGFALLGGVTLYRLRLTAASRGGTLVASSLPADSDLDAYRARLEDDLKR